MKFTKIFLEFIYWNAFLWIITWCPKEANPQL